MTAVLCAARVDPVSTYAKSQPERLAIRDLSDGRSWTWAELDRDVDQTAAWLCGQLGPASAARVATLGRNSAAMLLLQFACVRAGAIYVPLNWRLAAAELQVLVEQAQPVLLFHDAGPGVPHVHSELLSDLPALVSGAPQRPPAEARLAFDAPATILFTSGTSGRPKGVIVSEENAFWGSTNFILGNGVSGSSVFLCDMPLFHTAGLYANARTPILAGATLLVSSGFDAQQTLARLADPTLGITHYFSVPQMARAMWERPEFAPQMLQGLEVYATGGAPNPAAQVERFVRAGVRMSDGFGMSETCSNFGMPVGDPARLLAKAGSCGLPYMGVRARIVRDDGHEADIGEAGELWIAGPMVTQGYWNAPTLTAAAFSDGWFRTGDAALRDADGFYFIVDRRKDMYISGGENVYPAEVEAVLAELDCLAEAAVIGIPNERWGEVGCAYVVAAAGADVNEQSVVDHCRQRLAKFKVPAQVIIASTLPRTASGKVQKHLLRARSATQAGT